MMMLTSTGQTQVEVSIVGFHLNARAHDLVYGGVCSSNRVCEGVCEGVSIVSYNKTCPIDICLITN